MVRLITSKFGIYDVQHSIGGGTPERFIPEDFFGLIYDANGWIAHCAIQNVEAFGQALEFYLSQWQEKNPFKHSNAS